MAKRVRVTADCDVAIRSPEGGVRVVLAYRAGFDAIVPDEHADQIVAAGCGEVVADATPNKRRA